jgi:hypothetical protein
METLVNQNLLNLVDVSNGMLCYEDWCVDMLEWNTVFFFRGDINEDVWRMTKSLLENKRFEPAVTLI